MKSFNIQEKALELNSSLEVIELLLKEQKERALNEALVRLQGALPALEKMEIGANLVGETFNYTRLEVMQEAIKPFLLEHGFFYRFDQIKNGQAVTVKCVLTHIDGASVAAKVTVHEHQDGRMYSEQATGAAITYAKRYTLKNVLGLIEVEKDVDERSTKRAKGDFTRNPIPSAGISDGRGSALADNDRKDSAIDGGCVGAGGIHAGGEELAEVEKLVLSEEEEAILDGFAEEKKAELEKEAEQAEAHRETYLVVVSNLMLGQEIEGAHNVLDECGVICEEQIIPDAEQKAIYQCAVNLSENAAKTAEERLKSFCNVKVFRKV